MPRAYRSASGRRGLPDVLRREYNKLLETVQDLAAILPNTAITHANVSIGTDTAKVRTNSAISFRINGLLYTKASTDDLWTLSGSNVAAGSNQVYLLLLDAAGTASIAAGTAAAELEDVVYPDVPANKSVIGYITVENGTASNFVPGTTALDAADITTTYYNGFPSAVYVTAAPTETVTTY